MNLFSKCSTSNLDEEPCFQSSIIEIKQTGAALSFFPVQSFPELFKTSDQMFLHFSKALTDCVANPHWRGPTVSSKNALCWVCDFHKVCEVLPGCVFLFSVSKVRKWWLTIFVWLDILLISSQDLIVYPFHFVFLLQGASWCLWCSLMYDAILLLLNLYLYRFTYFLYLSPLFFNFPCAYCSKNPCLRSIIDDVMWTAISFFTLMYDLRNCKNAFTVLVCKMYV